MKIEAHAHPTPQREWHIVSRNENFFESVTDLEFPKRTVALVPIVIVPIRYIRDPSTIAYLHGLGHKSIRWFLIQVARPDSQIQDRCNILPINEVQKPDNLFTGIGAYEIASSVKFAVPFDRLF
jgi:hypothetical protein